MDDWYFGIIAILRENWAGKKFEIFYDALLPYLLKEQEQNNFQQAAITCNAGTTMMMIQFGYAYFRRIDKENQDHFMSIFCLEMIKTIETMQQQINKLLVEYVR